MTLPLELWITEIASHTTDATQLIMRLVCKAWMRGILRILRFTWRPWSVLPLIALESDDARLAKWAVDTFVPRVGYEVVPNAAYNAGGAGHANVLEVLLHLCDVYTLSGNALNCNWPRPTHRCLIRRCPETYHTLARMYGYRISEIAGYDTANHKHVCACAQIAADVSRRDQCARIIGLPLKPELRLDVLTIIERRVRAIRRSWVKSGPLARSTASDARFDAWWRKNGDAVYARIQLRGFHREDDIFEYWWVHRNDPDDPEMPALTHR